MATATDYAKEWKEKGYKTINDVPLEEKNAAIEDVRKQLVASGGRYVGGFTAAAVRALFRSLAAEYPKPPQAQIAKAVPIVKPADTTAASPKKINEAPPAQANPVAKYEEPKATRDGESTLASDLKPAKAGGLINVVKDYRWQISENIDPETPYVQLTEYEMGESLIKKVIDQYTGANKDNGGGQGIIRETTGISENKGILDTYKNIIDKRSPTNFNYIFPHVSKTAFELSTAWKDIGDVGEALKQIPGVGELLGKAVDTATTAVKLSKAFQPGVTVGVQDRPKIFETHSERSLRVSFILFNTISIMDYTKNSALAKLLMTQNLYNKKDYVTGVPPVFYDVLVPGQYYSYASYVSDIRIENLGNVRIIDGQIIPDAYQFDLTFTELLKPSKNQFEAIFNGDARQQVQTATR